MQSATLDVLLRESTASPEQLVAQYQPTVEVIQALKDHSAEFYSTDPAEALRIAERAYGLSQLLPNPAPALGAWALANAYVTQDLFSDAAALFEEARQLYLDNAYSLESARMCAGYVAVLAYQGDLDRALEIVDECEPILRSSSQHNSADLRALCNLLMNAGIAHELQGAYEDSLAVYEQQIQIAEELDDQVLLGQLQHNRGYTLIHLNAFDEALGAFEVAEQICLENNLFLELVTIYTNQAILFTKTDDSASSKQALKKAELLLPKLGNAHEQRHLLAIWTGLLNIQMGDYIENSLIASLRLAQKAFEHNGPLELEKLAWVTLGKCHLERKDWTQSAVAFRAALNLNAEEQDTLIAFRSWYGLAKLAEYQNQTDDSCRYYNLAIKQIESVRGEIETDLYRADFLTDKLSVYHDFANLHISMGHIEQALYVAERAKARVIGERFSSSLVNSQPTAHSDRSHSHLPTPALREKLDTLEQLYQQAASAAGQSVDEQIAKIESEARQLAHTSPEQRDKFLNSATNDIIDLAHVQEHLSDHTLLYYHIVREQIWVFVINENGIKDHTCVANVSETKQLQLAIAQSVDRMLELSVHFGVKRANRNAPALIADANKHLQALYQQLFQPIADTLPDNQPLYLSTDGLLHAIPFHALYDGEQYLIEQHAISYVPSLTVFRLCMQPQAKSDETKPDEIQQPQSVLLFGYDNKILENDLQIDAPEEVISIEVPEPFLSPDVQVVLRRNEHQFLPAVESELNWLQQLFASAKCYRRAEATTEQFLNSAPHSSLIHFAAHAHFRIDNPMLSAFTLADRRLTLAEINALQLRADLVVLSGCETTHGQIRGTDLLSLAGGFLSAGARSLLVSLWRVGDAITAKLMADFYQTLIAGESRCESLRMAQCAILTAARNSPELALYAHPAYWAPFTLIGNAEPLQLETNPEI